LEQIAGCAAYLWSEVTIPTATRLRERGIPVIREKYNCHKAVAREILVDAYSRLGAPVGHDLTPERIAKERQELALADWVVCSNQCVRDSLVQEGVPETKLIDSSYGWDPERFSGSDRLLDSCDGVTVLFVGYICVRKGAHLLLRAWADANVKGRLVLIGGMEPAIQAACGDIMNRSDVHVLPFSNSVGAAFRSADVFAFPSLEEGGPLVIYEAMGHGLPSIVSPMGAGRGLVHGREGFVVAPYDHDAWVDALRALAASAELRKCMGDTARATAAEFTWARVGARRREAILERLGAKPASGQAQGSQLPRLPT
jgi:glycosyltransferase involved in cell wall biosynthesis